MLSAAVEEKQDGAVQVAPLFLLFVWEVERAQRALAERASLITCSARRRWNKLQNKSNQQSCQHTPLNHPLAHLPSPSLIRGEVIFVGA